MTKQQWLEVFQEIGRTMRDGLPAILSIENGTTPLGRGAGGDKTFPVDKWAEDIVLSSLEQVHSSGESFTLISEEVGIRTFGEGDRVVLVDPVDGSNNAKSGIPFFATSIALLEGSELARLSVGYVSNLATGDAFWAIQGEGAYKNGARMRTPATDAITIVAYEATNPGRDIARILPLLREAKRTRCFGSTALDLVYLASGAISVFATATASRAFDYAAALLILKEAGGAITDLEGGKLDMITVGLDRTVPLLASKNDATHVRALELLHGDKGGID